MIMDKYCTSAYIPSCLENTTHFFSKIITDKSGVRGIYDIMSLGPQRDESNQSEAYTYLPTSVGIDEFALYTIVSRHITNI